MNKRIKKLSILILSCLAVLCLLPALLPQVQDAAVSFVETHKNDDINDVFWKQQMFAFASLGIIFIVVLDLILLTETGKILFCKFIKKFDDIFQNIRKNKKYLFILIGLYFLGYFSIIRANFWNYTIDDLHRQLEGSREWVNFYRYFAEIGSIFIHTSMNIFDVAPLTQLIAIVILAFASFFIIGIFSDNNYSIKLCISSLPLGLFPYFLSNFSYRYDAPYMALSLCISIIPFLFIDDLQNYIISSIICNFVMCTSYQASSGIYVFMAILVFLKLLLIEKESADKLFKFTLSSILSYVFTLIIFSILFIEQAEGGSYVDESAHFSMILPNTVEYIKTIIDGIRFTPIFIFSIIITILFLFACFSTSKISKLPTIVVTLVALVICYPLTFGSYLALGRAEFIPRTFIGIGVFISCLAVFSLSLVQNSKSKLKTIITVFTFCLSYCCVAVSYAFGNAQYYQKQYIHFRGTILAQDLSELIISPSETLDITFNNDIGYTPPVEVLKKDYPFIQEAIDNGFSGERAAKYILEYLNLVTLTGRSNKVDSDKDLPVLKDNAYHTIQGKDNKFIVTLKNPQYKANTFSNFSKEE